ncbi:uncharacterized protein OCT59_015807 [Rhizophagus irregularis]|uniref:Uncharacterized protein n=1 Tax=Rhizophagus irregularis TaxID=588596 RepID=A0A916EK91_9GLOM|nr:hypothetical protein OCT59_015807 [Rhizophagus irregularis]CAB4492675.1 unnamed protein product [Rhizophagus irregularis]CAB5393861.1 unnamed protein product [Rhizophagus irregularis]
MRTCDLTDELITRKAYYNSSKFWNMQVVEDKSDWTYVIETRYKAQISDTKKNMKCIRTRMNMSGNNC